MAGREVGAAAGGTAVATRVDADQLVRREMVAGLMRPVAEPSELLQAQEGTRALVAEILQEGRDFGTIPGAGKKRTMFQPGAERCASAFALAAEFHVIESEIDHDRPISFVKRTWKWHPSERGKKVWTETPGQSEGLYRYVVRCRLVHRQSGVVVGEGVGAASTMESKYIDRPRDLENTVLKMAKKRAHVDAVLTTLGLHDQFGTESDDDEGSGGDRPARRQQRRRQRPKPREQDRPRQQQGGEKRENDDVLTHLEGLRPRLEAANASAQQVGWLDDTIADLTDGDIARKEAVGVAVEIEQWVERRETEAGDDVEGDGE